MPESFNSTSVDNFFSSLKVVEDPLTQPFLIGLGRHDSTVAGKLESAQRSFGDEGYKKFAEAVASDSRLAQYLPDLFLDAISPSRYSHSTGSFNSQVDTDGSDTLKKSEIEAASKDTVHFDPVFRKALKYGADNFDKLITLAPKDGRVYGNNWDFTSDDQVKASEQIKGLPGKQKLLRDQQIVLQNFDQIDTNKSGKITNSEVSQWSGSPKLSLDAYPQMHYDRRLPSSEELTKVDYQNKIGALDSDVKRVQQFWGLR